MGDEIAYLMPTKYKIFLGKVCCPLTTPARGPASWTPVNTSLTDCPSHNSKLNDQKLKNSLDYLILMSFLSFLDNSL